MWPKFLKRSGNKVKKIRKGWKFLRTQRGFPSKLSNPKEKEGPLGKVLKKKILIESPVGSPQIPKETPLKKEGGGWPTLKVRKKLMEGNNLFTLNCPTLLGGFSNPQIIEMVKE